MRTQPLALYIHWPFCLKKCPYCDFNSHLLRPEWDQDIFSKMLYQELAFYGEFLQPRHLTSIFFGGGTPSLLTADAIHRLIEIAVSLFPPKKNIEITLEANPSSLEIARLPHFKEAGINRLSLGVQSFSDEMLSFLGRQHSAAQARQALIGAYRTFSRVNFDLIYGLPKQTLKEWSQQLDVALTFHPTHLSAYQLTIEPNTAFATLYRKKAFKLPCEEEAAKLYRLTEEKLQKSGLYAYEISNYATAGQQSQHNLTYWHYGDYLGIGAGAHSRFTHKGKRYAQENIKSPALWCQQVQKKGSAIEEQHVVSPQQAALEMFLMGMRLKDGISFKEFFQKTGIELLSFLDPQMLYYTKEAGYLEQTSSHLKASFEGRLRLEAMLPSLIA